VCGEKRTWLSVGFLLLVVNERDIRGVEGEWREIEARLGLGGYMHWNVDEEEKGSSVGNWWRYKGAAKLAERRQEG
jgi:hypothetical protein